MHCADLAIASDEDGRRHALEVVFARYATFRIVNNPKTRGVLLQELIRRTAVVIHVDADYDESPWPKRFFYGVQPRKGETTRRAPGRPEVEIDNFARIGTEVEYICLFGIRGRRGK